MDREEHNFNLMEIKAKDFGGEGRNVIMLTMAVVYSLTPPQRAFHPRSRQNLRAAVLPARQLSFPFHCIALFFRRHDHSGIFRWRLNFDDITNRTFNVLFFFLLPPRAGLWNQRTACERRYIHAGSLCRSRENFHSFWPSSRTNNVTLNLFMSKLNFHVVTPKS